MTSSNNRLANYSVIRRLARRARDAGASILFLPECCCFLGETADESVAAASPLDEEEENGHVIDYYRALAREFGLWLSLGGIQETCDDEGGETTTKKMYNTHVVLRDDGSTAAAYRKVHLFELASEGLHESRSTEPGDQLVVVPDAPCGEDLDGGGGGGKESKSSAEKEGTVKSSLFHNPSPSKNQKKKNLGPLGLSICYDLRFPELYQQLRFEKGARVLAVPAAFTQTTGRAGHWEVLLRARAIETQCAVVAAAQVGGHNRGGRRRSWGQAMIVDASGRVLARMKSADDDDVGGGEGEGEGEGERKGGGRGDKEEKDNDSDSDDDDGKLVGIIVADLDEAAVEGARERMPVAEHREAGRRALGL